MNCRYLGRCRTLAFGIWPDVDLADARANRDISTAVSQQWGELTAAFTGNRGWFWRNRTEEPVTVTLRTGGDYAEVRAP